MSKFCFKIEISSDEAEVLDVNLYRTLSLLIAIFRVLNAVFRHLLENISIKLFIIIKLIYQKIELNLTT